MNVLDGRKMAATLQHRAILRAWHGAASPLWGPSRSGEVGDVVKIGKAPSPFLCDTSFLDYSSVSCPQLTGHVSAVGEPLEDTGWPPTFEPVACPHPRSDPPWLLNRALDSLPASNLEATISVAPSSL